MKNNIYESFIGIKSITINGKKIILSDSYLKNNSLTTKESSMKKIHKINLRKVW